jgi:hypothetical protein
MVAMVAMVAVVGILLEVAAPPPNMGGRGREGELTEVTGAEALE